jgi:hypothetical protein
LNASYRYSVRGANAAFCTDIATGAHAHVYPPKHSHWGHGLISDKYETVVMMRNIAHHDRGAGPATATLSVYDSGGGEAKRTITVGSESAEAIYLRDLVGGSDQPQTISWFVRADKPNIEAYWVSFSPDGSICGEHAF